MGWNICIRQKRSELNLGANDPQWDICCLAYLAKPPINKAKPRLREICGHTRNPTPL